VGFYRGEQRCSGVGRALVDEEAPGEYHTPVLGYHDEVPCHPLIRQSWEMAVDVCHRIPEGFVRLRRCRGYHEDCMAGCLRGRIGFQSCAQDNSECPAAPAAEGKK